MSENSKQPRWAGIDCARLIGVALIFVTHALSITGHDALATVHGVRLGRIGTALFLIVAGYMAAVTARSPEAWLAKRLRTLFLPYWIVLAPTFVAAWLTQYKTFDAWQVASQFLGLGLFTHGGELVNVTTWFISAILVLYFIAYTAKRVGETMVILAWLAVATCLVLFAGPNYGWVTHASVFLVAYLLPRNGALVPVAAAVAGIAYLSAYTGLNNGNLRYVGLALLVFALLANWRTPLAPMEPLANHSYEWFLLHGPMLHVAKMLTGGQFWPVLIVAIVLTSLGVIVLKQMTLGLHFALDGLPARPERAPAAEIGGVRVA